MAYLQLKHCSKCEAETAHVNGSCSTCREKEFLKCKHKENEAWNNLTVEGKIEFLRQEITRISNYRDPRTMFLG